MNKIQEAFKNKAFIPYVLAGAPSLDATERFIEKLANAGASLIEIGIPFSDPVAEGPVIQEASKVALANKITVDDILAMVVNVNKKIDIPLIFMTYINSIFAYGKEAFFKRCQEVGISGVIIPDLPYEERYEVLAIAKKYQITIIFLIAPTSIERIKMIAQEAEGFIYLISSLGVTGMREKISADIAKIVAKIKIYTDTPVAIGFGISNPQQAYEMSKIANGVIVGSAIVNIINKYGENADFHLESFASKMIESIKKT